MSEHPGGVGPFWFVIAFAVGALVLILAAGQSVTNRTTCLRGHTEKVFVKIWMDVFHCDERKP